MMLYPPSDTMNLGSETTKKPSLVEHL